MEGHYSQMSALQSSQIFTRDDVKPSGANSHLALIMSQENDQSGDVRREGGGGGRMKGAKPTVWRKMK